MENTIFELAMEQFEIGSYISLISAASDLGETGIAETCENILIEEESMAENLIVELPEVTSEYLELMFLRERSKLAPVNGYDHADCSFVLKRFAPA